MIRLIPVRKQRRQEKIRLSQLRNRCKSIRYETDYACQKNGLEEEKIINYLIQEKNVGRLLNRRLIIFAIKMYKAHR